MNNYYDTGNFYDLENKLFTFVIQPRGYGKRKFEERKHKMKVDITLTKEETNILKNFLNEIKLDCSAIYCWACPFNIIKQEPYGQITKEYQECIIKEILPTVLNKYGYKEDNND